MTVLVPISVSKAGRADLDAVLVAATTAGDSVDAASGLLVVMKNADSSTHTLTVAAPVASARAANFGALPVAALSLVVLTNDVGLLTIPPGYANASGDFVWTYDDDTSVTIGVFSLAP